MITKREILIFLSGAEAFHTLSHMILSISHTLPLTAFGITFDQQFNMWAIIINAIITGILLW